MDLFPDGGFVRLQSRANSKYVHADEDWERISLCPNGAVPALNAVWRVEHSVSEGTIFVLLQNAAYCRYLSFRPTKAKFGHRGFRTEQLDRSEPNVLPGVLHMFPWMWTAQRMDPPDQAFVTLSYYPNFYLRANGKYLVWNNRVTADDDVDPNFPRVSTMMQWTVHAVASSPVPPPPLPPKPEDEAWNGTHDGYNTKHFRALIVWRSMHTW